MKTYNCLNCGAEKLWRHSYHNKYCSNECQHSYQWNTVTKPRIESGGCREPITLKKYLIDHDGDLCLECGQGPEWNGKPLSLQVDHIDGNSDNNMPTNLRLLCPNCHTQQETSKQRTRKNTRRNKYLQEYKRD
jgi:hypothetical protein